MRHNALKTFDNKVAATTDQIVAAITRIGHARPVDAGNLHLQIQTATAPDFSDAVTAIDTYANEADRAKVLLFDGSGFVPIEEGGAGKSFGGQSVLADVASIEPLQYVRLRWFEVLEPMRYLAWEGRYFPASGGGGGASSTSASTTGTLMVNITGDATGGWNIDGSSTWLASGATISLAPGQYTVFFKRAANVPPNPKPATVTVGAVTEITGAYSIDAPAGSWVDVAITGPADARWSYNGGLTWIVSGFEVNLLGDYTLTFKPVAGYDTPSNQSITAGAFPGDDTYAATYAAAGSGATGYSAYLLGPELISAQADPTKCVGNSATNVGLAIINGKLFLTPNVQVGSESDWTACSGSPYTSMSRWDIGYAIRAGKLYAIDASRNATQIGTATSWEKLSGYSYYYDFTEDGGSFSGCGYAINAAGELYMLLQANATRVGALTGWEVISGTSEVPVNGSSRSAAVGINAGKLYEVSDDVATQIGVATNWAAVGPRLDGRGMVINDDGELFVVTAAPPTASVVKVGAATNWTIASRRHAINATGELYNIDRITAVATQVGTATNWSDVSNAYALNAAGEIYTLSDAVATRYGSYSDWTKIDMPVFVRSTAL